MIAVDTNLLVYAHRSALPQHRRARQAIERAMRESRGWGVTVSSISEFWSVVTHPSAAGRPSAPAEATGFLQRLHADGGMQIWSPGKGFGERLWQLAVDLEVSSVRIFDLQIALTALENGALELWTHDQAFARVPGLRLRDPLA